MPTLTDNINIENYFLNHTLELKYVFTLFLRHKQDATQKDFLLPDWLPYQS